MPEMALNRLSTADHDDAVAAPYGSAYGVTPRSRAVGHGLHLAGDDDTDQRLSFRASTLVMLVASLAGWAAVYGLLALML